MSDAPVFNRLAVFTHETIDVDAYAMVGDRFAFHWEERVVVWDYILNRSVSWVYPSHLSDVGSTTTLRYLAYTYEVTSIHRSSYRKMN
jgi:hypothetical protein